MADSLLAAITGARWFAGKGRHAELTGVTALPWLGEPGQWPAVRFEIAEVSYPDEAPAAGRSPRPPTELYQLALAYWPEPQPGQAGAELCRVDDPDRGELIGYDAAQDATASRLLLGWLLAERSLVHDEVRTDFRLTARDGLDPDLVPRMHRGQQSNTSVMYGEAAILKLFRRIELGRNLDIEVHDALGRVGARDVAQLYGYVRGRWTYGGSPVEADLAMLVEQLRGARDGWEFALASRRAGQDFTAEAERLGRALAETHAALAAAFPTGRQAGAELADRMTARLLAAQAVAPELAPYAEGLRACFDTLRGTELATQRVHGDFHLGQTLHTPEGWKIIDFEGEPAKSLAERSAPDNVARDLAGMLRSFAYAAASEPGSPGWVQACRAAFLRGYAGGELEPSQAAMLRAYEADKAIYEVVYEVRNRPDWVAIPLAAVVGLAAPAVPDPDPSTPS